jgi:hypothetical protein
MSGSSREITLTQGNYSPDKEFRYLRHVCYFQWFGPTGRPGHFCLALHVAMQVGLYLHRYSGARRTVSEDPAVYSFLLITPTCHIFTAGSVSATDE